MADGMNKWIGIGNIARDPEFRVTTGGNSVLKFSIACNERFKDKSGEWKDRAEFVNVVMFGKRAESLSKFLEKGNPICVEGSIHTSSYEKDGEKRYRTEVIASNIILLGSRSGGGGKRQESEPQRTGGGGFSDEDYGDNVEDGVPF